MKIKGNKAEILSQVPNERKVKLTYSSALSESLKTLFPNLSSHWLFDLVK